MSDGPTLEEISAMPPGPTRRQAKLDHPLRPNISLMADYTAAELAELDALDERLDAIEFTPIGNLYRS